MAYSKLEKDSLLHTLNELLTASEESSDDVYFKKFECKDDYIIHYIPPQFTHPVQDIINTVGRSFFLVSKLPQPTTSDHNESTEDTEYDDLVPPTLPIITHHHVYVGTPISQKLYHLFKQRDLHPQETTKLERSLNISSLGKLEIKYARYFLSLYIQIQHQQENLPEMWLVCDQKDYQGVSFMGMVPSEPLAESKKLENSGIFFNTVMITNKNLDHTKKDSFLRDQKKKHMVFHRASHAETHGYAKYHIYGSPDNMTSDCSESGITMEFAWDGVNKILQRPPPSSNAVLNICAHPEAVCDILLGISDEVNALVNHFSVVQTKVSGMDDDEEEEDDEIDNDNDKVLKFLDDLKHNLVTSEAKKTDSVSESPSGNLAAPLRISEALQRQDLDNTEHLWLFLKDFTSQTNILHCLKVIFDALFEGEYHPILHATNQTKIGELIKEVFHCKTNIERAGVKAKISNVFNKCEALKCVVDIGLEKLRNDYTHYFIKQELVTKDKLEYYLACDVPISEKIQRLLKFHCVLSLVTLSITYVHNINYDGLRQLVSASLKFYEDHPHTEHPIFSLSLPAYSTSSTIKTDCIQQLQPQTWVVAITTMNEYISVIQVEESDNLQQSFDDEERSPQSNYLVTTGTSRQLCV